MFKVTCSILPHFSFGKTDRFILDSYATLLVAKLDLVAALADLPEALRDVGRSEVLVAADDAAHHDAADEDAASGCSSGEVMPTLYTTTSGSPKSAWTCAIAASSEAMLHTSAA